MSDNSKDIEIEDARARVKELEDQLNEKIVDNTNTHVKLKQAYEEITEKDKLNKSFQYEYQWLAGQYHAMLSEIHDKLDELNYNIKHSSLKEVMDQRNEEIKAAKEKKAQEELEQSKTVIPKPPVPKDTEDIKEDPRGYA